MIDQEKRRLRCLVNTHLVAVRQLNTADLAVRRLRVIRSLRGSCTDGELTAAEITLHRSDLAEKRIYKKLFDFIDQLQ